MSVLDDEWEMIRLIERIRDEARTLDLAVPGWWLVPDAVEQILASTLCDHVDDHDPWYMHVQRSYWEGLTRERTHPLERLLHVACVSFPT